MRRLLLAALLAGALPAGAQTILITPLVVQDIAYHAGSGRMYAVLPAGMGGPETSVAEVHPGTGAILTRIAIPDTAGGGARHLALSDDGTVLWVGVDGGRRIRRYAVPAFTPGTEFSVGVTPDNRPHVVLDMAVAPGTTSTLVVARGGAAASEFVAYDDGVARPARQWGERAAFYEPTRFVEPTYGGRHRLDASGLVADSPVRSGTLSLLLVEAGLGYDGLGAIVDLGAEQVLGTCAVAGWPVPAPDLDTIFHIGSDRLSTCQRSTFRLTGVLTLPTHVDGYRAGVRTGLGRATLVDQNGRLIVADGLTTPLPAPPSVTGQPWQVFHDAAARLTLTGCVRCAPGDVLSVQGFVGPGGTLPAVEIKAAVIMPDGTAIAATALGESHLEVQQLSSGVGATLLHAALPRGLPTGTWQVELAFIDPNSGVVLSRAAVPFEVLP